MLGKTTSLTIQTPEGVTFELPLASPISRCLALAVDVAVVIILSTVFKIVLGILGSSVADMTMSLMVLSQFVIWIFYGIVLEWMWRGQTIGKRVLNLQVIDERGLNLSIKQIVIRNILRVVDSMPPKFYMVGGISCLFTKRCQRLGDLAAGTVVIRKLRVNEPSIDDLFSGEENSFRQAPRLEARLRQQASPSEAQIVLDAILRRDDMAPAERLKVFSELANHFRESNDFIEKNSTSLSDEQLVRNIADSIFRKH